MLDETTNNVVCRVRVEFVLTDLWRALAEYKTYFHALPEYCHVAAADYGGPISESLTNNFMVTPVVNNKITPGTVMFFEPEPKNAKRRGAA